MKNVSNGDWISRDLNLLARAVISNVIIERMRTEIEAVRSPRWDLYSRFFSTYLHGTARHTFPRYAALCRRVYRVFRKSRHHRQENV